MLTLAQAARAGVAGGLACALLVGCSSSDDSPNTQASNGKRSNSPTSSESPGVSRASAVDAWQQTGPVGPVRTVNVTTSAS